MMCFWNNLYQVRYKENDCKTKQFKVLEARKPKGLSRIANHMSKNYNVKH